MTLAHDIAAHYRHGGLEAALLDGLRAAGHDPERLRPGDLGGADEFHIGGPAATAALADRLGLGPGSRVLDLGCGIGGTARHLAARYGCEVVGLDLSAEYVAVATSLARRMGLGGRVRFEAGSATALPFADASFDGVTMLHAGMNIAGKAALAAGVCRVLKPGGFFAIYDVMRLAPGEIAFPVPWASAAEHSFVESPDAYRAALTVTGFTIESVADRTETARAFAAAMKARAAAGPQPLGLHIIMGADAKRKMANMIAALQAGVVAPVEIIARRSPP